MKRFRIVLLLVMIASLLLVALPVQADYGDRVGIYDCVNITHNLTGDAVIGEDQLKVELWDYGAQAEFVFINTGPAASSIADVYFDDGTLLGIASINNGPGVSFSQPATPGNLPGGDEVVPPFEATADFSADSDSPVEHNGVNPGEQVGILFDLLPGVDVAGTATALETGDLRIGIHVQGFASGGSEGFICGPTPPTAIELISFVAFAGDGNVGLGWETGTEVDNAGFNLYRASSADGPWTKLNSALIAAQGDAVSGASYSFVDSPGTGTFYYLLEDVDYNGETTLHGPVEATVAPLLLRPFFRPVVPTR